MDKDGDSAPTPPKENRAKAKTNQTSVDASRGARKDGKKRLNSRDVFPTPDDETLRNYWRRNPIARQIVDSPIEDAVSPRPVFKTKDGERLLDLERELERVGFWDASVQGTRLERVESGSYLHLIYSGGASLESKPGDNAKLEEIIAKPKKDIVKTEYEKDPMSPLYAKPISYEVTTKGGNKTVHASRLWPLVSASLDDDEPTSILYSLADQLYLMGNQDWAFGQLPWKYAAGFNVAYLPNDATDPEYDEFEADFFPNENNLYVIRKGPTPELSYDFEFKYPGGHVDPKEYTARMWDEVAGGSGIPKCILFGTEAGAVTGSEINVRDYMKTIARLREQRFEWLLRKLYPILREHNDIDIPEDVVDEWPSVWELNDNEQAELDVKRARAIHTTAMTYKILKDAGVDVVFDNGRLLVGGHAIQVGAAFTDAAAADTCDGHDHDHEHTHTDNREMTPAETDEWGLWHTPLESVNESAEAELRLEVDKVHAAVDAFVDTLPAPQGENRDNLLPLGLVELAGLSLATEAMASTLSTHMLGAMTLCMNTTMSALGAEGMADVKPWPVGDPRAAAYVKSHSLMSIKGGWAPGVEADVKRELSEGISLGESQAKLKTRVAGVFDAKDYEIARIVRSETARAATAARGETLAENGIKEMQFIASPTACQEICVPLNGARFPVSEAANIIPQRTHPNCTCDTRGVIPGRDT